MKILITGANGYIGSRLIEVLAQEGHEIICTGRTPIKKSSLSGKTQYIHHDFKQSDTNSMLPANIDVAYYLMHSMRGSIRDFVKDEKTVAESFMEYIKQSHCKQIIYLSGLTNAQQLSLHFASRSQVEQILRDSNIPLTVLKASIIIGAGSASFEIIRDLVEKLPIMIAPKWVQTKSQPIAIYDVIHYLAEVKNSSVFHNQSYDIAGPDIVSYKELLLTYAKVRNMKRIIIPIPIMTPRLSSYWLYFITSVNYTLAVNLVDSLKMESTSKNDQLSKILKHNCKNLNTSISDALTIKKGNTPAYGILSNKQSKVFDPDSLQSIQNKLHRIGGDSGWYYANYLWKIRGWLDKLQGGVGLRRGRKNPIQLIEGDHLDFWRIIYVSTSPFHILLKAEMKLPGEAWLEFKIDHKQYELKQNAIFRPKGIRGILYWHILSPVHYFIFRGMIKKIVR